MSIGGVEGLTAREAEAGRGLVQSRYRRDFDVRHLLAVANVSRWLCDRQQRRWDLERGNLRRSNAAERASTAVSLAHKLMRIALHDARTLRRYQ